MKILESLSGRRRLFVLLGMVLLIGHLSYMASFVPNRPIAEITTPKLRRRGKKKANTTTSSPVPIPAPVLFVHHAPQRPTLGGGRALVPLLVVSDDPRYKKIDTWFAQTMVKHEPALADSDFGACGPGCLGPVCWSNSEGQCMPNPHWVRPASPNPHQTTALPCVGPLSKRIEARPAMPSSVETWSEKLQMFQHLTSATLPYIPWQAPTCASDAASDAMPRILTADHTVSAATSPHKYYRIRNFCLRAVGAMCGDKPEVGAYRGRDESFAAMSNPHNMEDWVPTVFNDWLQRTKSCPTTTTPKCYLDTKVLIMPIWSRSNNPMHVWHRLAKLNGIMEEVWPESKGHNHSNIVTMYVFPNGPVINEVNRAGHPNLNNLQATSFFQFLRLVTPSAFSIFGNEEPTAEQVDFLFTAGSEQQSGSSIEDQRRAFTQLLQEPLACFSEAVVYMDCIKEDCGYAYSSLDYNEKEYDPTRPGMAMMPIMGRRSPALQQGLINKLQQCLLYEKRGQRSAAVEEGLNVLLNVKSWQRYWLAMPFIVTEMAHTVEAGDGRFGTGASFYVHEMSPLYRNFADWVHMYAKMDILIASYGTGLMLGNVMRPGSVAIELNSNCLAVNAINALHNLRCDYGGSAHAAGVHHIAWKHAAMSVKVFNQGGDYNYDLAPQIPIQLLEMALCVRQRDFKRSLIPTNLTANATATLLSLGWLAQGRPALLATETDYKTVCGDGSDLVARHNEWYWRDINGWYFTLLARTMFPYYFLQPPTAHSRIPLLVATFTKYQAGQDGQQEQLIPRLGGRVLVIVPCSITWAIVNEVELFGAYSAAQRVPVDVYQTPVAQRNTTLCRLLDGNPDVSHILWDLRHSTMVKKLETFPSFHTTLSKQASLPPPLYDLALSYLGLDISLSSGLARNVIEGFV